MNITKTRAHLHVDDRDDSTKHPLYVRLAEIEAGYGKLRFKSVNLSWRKGDKFSENFGELVTHLCCHMKEVHATQGYFDVNIVFGEIVIESCRYLLSRAQLEIGEFEART
jgi:hypothetical protein